MTALIFHSNLFYNGAWLKMWTLHVAQVGLRFFNMKASFDWWYFEKFILQHIPQFMVNKYLWRISEWVYKNVFVCLYLQFSGIFVCFLSKWSTFSVTEIQSKQISAFHILDFITSIIEKRAIYVMPKYYIQ